MRLDYKATAAEGFKPILALLKYVASSGLDEKRSSTYCYLRVSQINGCPYCVDMHWSDAKKAGEDLRKLNALTVWRDTPFFSLMPSAPRLRLPNPSPASNMRR